MTGAGGGWGCGAACAATRCRLDLRVDDGDSVSPCAGLVSILLLRFRVLGGSSGLRAAIDGAAAADAGEAVVGFDVDEAAWLAA